MGCLLFANPNITDPLQKEHTEILTEIGWSLYEGDQKVLGGRPDLVLFRIGRLHEASSC